nr:MAG TPA: hypothetical protein [Bacteriophage sp.]
MYRHQVYQLLHSHSEYNCCLLCIRLRQKSFPQL